MGKDKSQRTVVAKNGFCICTVSVIEIVVQKIK